ncbi:hypothetical protein A2U01_0098484, partial [Trifolium medium]|nr:hypothetical protein [Trifolium medium]
QTFLTKKSEPSDVEQPDMSRGGNKSGRPTGAYGLAYIDSGQASLFL